MPRFYNPYNNQNFPGMNMNGQDMDNQTFENQNMEQKGCGCNNNMNNDQNMGCTCKNFNQGCGCKRPMCPTTYKCCPPIVTCSKEVIDQYHVTKQPYVHNYHTEIVHHYVTQNEFIPNYTCSEVHVNEPNNTNYPR